MHHYGNAAKYFDSTLERKNTLSIDVPLSLPILTGRMVTTFERVITPQQQNENSASTRSMQSGARDNCPLWPPLLTGNKSLRPGQALLLPVTRAVYSTATSTALLSVTDARNCRNQATLCCHLWPTENYIFRTGWDVQKRKNKNKNNNNNNNNS